VILKGLPVYPSLLFVNVWDAGFRINGQIPIPFADVYEDIEDLVTGDWVKLLVLNRTGSENSIELGEIWVSIIEFIHEGFAILGKVVVSDPSIPETVQMDKVVFYPQNIYDIRSVGAEGETEPEFVR